MEMLLALGFGPGATLAFVMAAGFIADTASTPLVVSNLVNIVSADFFGIGFGRYASVMVPVNVAAVAATLAVLDRQRGVEGQSVSVRVDIGGRRIIKKKKKKRS